MADLRSRILHAAADLPVGDPTRRRLLRALVPRQAATPFTTTVRVELKNIYHGDLYEIRGILHVSRKMKYEFRLALFETKSGKRSVHWYDGPKDKTVKGLIMLALLGDRNALDKVLYKVPLWEAQQF